MTRPSRNKKLFIWRRDKFRCFYCKKKMFLPFISPVLEENSESELTFDHIIPKNKGGLHIAENLVTSCRECNQKKAEQEHPLIIFKKD